MRRRGLLLAIALAVRVAAILLCSRMVADVERYHRVATHVLDVSPNPYLAPRLYPYPPVWVWLEAGAEWVARRTALPFPVLVKLPVLAADLVLVVLLARWGAARGGSAGRAGWLYALHPVAVLVGAVHGQFEALALLAVVGALFLLQARRLTASALALAAGVALKSFPILLLPVLLLLVPRGERLRYAALATAPVALLLGPFALMDAGALGRELFGYGGVADFGWIGVWRGVTWMTTGALVRSAARFWASPVGLAKLVFLAAYAALVVALARDRLRLDAEGRSLAVLLAFQVFYGAVSAQYLAWVLPLGCLRPGRAFAVYSVAATAALAGFYVFLAPGVLLPADQAWIPRTVAGVAWALGALATLAAAAAWLVQVLLEGRRAS
jgi:uncharacterized membrane protein